MTLMIRWFPAGLWIFRIEVYVLGYGVVCAHRVSNSTVQISGFVYIPEYAETLCGKSTSASIHFRAQRMGTTKFTQCSTKRKTRIKSECLILFAHSVFIQTFPSSQAPIILQLIKNKPYSIHLKHVFNFRV
jgi:hypothetical protein